MGVVTTAAFFGGKRPMRLLSGKGLSEVIVAGKAYRSNRRLEQPLARRGMSTMAGQTPIAAGYRGVRNGHLPALLLVAPDADTVPLGGEQLVRLCRVRVMALQACFLLERPVFRLSGTHQGGFIMALVTQLAALVLGLERLGSRPLHVAIGATRFGNGRVHRTEKQVSGSG